MLSRDKQIQQRYTELKEEIARVAHQCERDPDEITLVAVTKGHPWEDVQAVYDAGCRDVGENRVQEALEKQTFSPPDLNWHFIGTLQTKKVNKVIGRFTLIHSVDTPSLAHHISQSCERMGVSAQILLQVNTSGEISKHGLSEAEWTKNFLEVARLPMIEIKGLMTMAPLMDDFEVIRCCFRRLRLLRDELVELSQGDLLLPHLSMGMSHDYRIAIQEGATLLRIGSALFEK